MKKRKILIVTTVAETLATILYDQPRHLDKFFDVSLATSGSGIEIERIKTREGVPVFRLPMFRGINLFFDIYSIFRMIFIILKVRPEVIHSYTPKAGLVSMISGWLCRVPIRIHTFTGLVYSNKTGFIKFVLVMVDRIICALATRVVPESLGVRAELIANSVTSKDLKLIGYGNIAGVDTDYFGRKAASDSSFRGQLYARYGVPRERFVFIYVGRLNKDKGVEDLVKAFKRLDIDAQLLIVGAVDKSHPVSSDTLAEMESSERITMVGFVDDVRWFLNISDILILPSYREGFPNVVLQAGACELPAIVSNISGCNEVISDGYNGWLISPGDVVGLAEAMRLAYMTDANHLGEMGRNARDLVKNRHEKEFLWNKLFEFYSDELGRV